MTELEKLAVRLANTLLSTRTGLTFHMARDEDRIDMTRPDFAELRSLSEAILEQAKQTK